MNLEITSQQRACFTSYIRAFRIDTAWSSLNVVARVCGIRVDFEGVLTAYSSDGSPKSVLIGEFAQ